MIECYHNIIHKVTRALLLLASYAFRFSVMAFNDTSRYIR